MDSNQVTTLIIVIVFISFALYYIDPSFGDISSNKSIKKTGRRRSNSIESSSVRQIKPSEKQPTQQITTDPSYIKIDSYSRQQLQNPKITSNGGRKNGPGFLLQRRSAEESIPPHGSHSITLLSSGERTAVDVVRDMQDVRPMFHNLDQDLGRQLQSMTAHDEDSSWQNTLRLEQLVARE